MSASAENEKENRKAPQSRLAEITAMLVRLVAVAALYALGFVILVNIYFVLPFSDGGSRLDADSLENLPLFVFSGTPFAFVWFLLAGLLSYGTVRILAASREVSVRTHVSINIVFLIILSHLVFLWSDTDYEFIHTVIYHLPAVVLHFWPWTREGLLLRRESSDEEPGILQGQ